MTINHALIRKLDEVDPRYYVFADQCSLNTSSLSCREVVMTNLKVNEQALNLARNQAGSFEIVNSCSKSPRREPTKEVRRQIESTFETLLDRIAAQDRDLNAWESKCLSAALIMMADDDYDSAAAAIEACERYPRDCPGLGRDLTIQDMRALYAMLKGWLSLSE